MLYSPHLKGSLAAHHTVDSSGWEYLPLSCLCPFLLRTVKAVVSIVVSLTNIRLPFVTVFLDISSFSTKNFVWSNPEIPDVHFACAYRIYPTCTNQLCRANTISSKLLGGIWPTVHVAYTFLAWKRQGSRFMYMQ